MGNLSSSFAESLTGTKQKEPVEPETAGVLSMDWQQLAAQAKRAANDMREVANNVPEAMSESEYDVAGAAEDVMAAAQRRREKPVGRRRERPAVNRNKTSQGSKTKKQSDMEMEF